MKKWFLLLACLVLICTACSALAEESAETAAAGAFSVMSEAHTGAEKVYFSSDYYLVLIKKDGAWWRVDARLDDRYREVYAALSSSGYAQEAIEEFDAYAWSLPVASAVRLEEEPLDGAALKAYAGEKLGSLLADGFTVVCVHVYTGDETDYGTDYLTLADESGKEYRVPLYMSNIGYESGILFQLDKGIYTYEFTCSGTAETLQKAVEDGTLGELVLDDGAFSGLSSSTMYEIMEESSKRRPVTEAEALSIRTVGDALRYISIAYSSDGGEKYVVLIEGKDCFWTATAVMDEHYRELYRAAWGSNSSYEANQALWDYQNSLPVTVEKVENGFQPHIEDLSAYTGKSLRELQEEGFEFRWYSASTTEEEKEAFNIPLVLKNSDGSVFRELNGSILCFKLNDFIYFTASKGLYEYDFEFEGNADTLAAAAADGSFPDLPAKKAVFTSISGDAPVLLGLDQ